MREWPVKECSGERFGRQPVLRGNFTVRRSANQGGQAQREGGASGEDSGGDIINGLVARGESEGRSPKMGETISKKLFISDEERSCGGENFSEGE